MQQIITALPLKELKSTSVPPGAKREAWLTQIEIREMLRVSPVQFMIADVGREVVEIPIADCFQFWKSEVTNRVAVMEHIDLTKYPDGYCYGASKWGITMTDKTPIVLLEKFH